MSIHNDWLSLIEVSGPFLAVPVLTEAFPQGLEELDGIERKRLRQAYEEWREALELEDARFQELHAAWIDEVLSRGLELDEDDKGDVLKRGDWCAANLQVTAPEPGVTLAPDFAVVDEQRANAPLMLIRAYDQSVGLDTTLKLDGWAATPAERMVQLCRAAGCRLGLVTNGEHWMLVDAPVGAVTTFASWYARIWGQEPVTLQAFVHLLGIRRFFVDESEQLPALLDRSLKYQDEVTDALGEQVRRAVEVLIQALDKADQDRNRELLRDVNEAVLYEAALTVMMRLVFLLSAEERGLLLLGDERYEANYALSTLRMQLRNESTEILERRWDAWSRLLALFRAVYGGIEHENLRLPALGGSLFDPDRFPFLEGRAKGSDWRTDLAQPLPIDNRTVLLLLDAIQQFQGRTLSYRALDVEQIGYVYEGLLERTVRRTAEVTLELDGTKSAKSPWATLAELESARLDGAEKLVELLRERTGSSASRVRNDLAKPVDDALADRLLAASHGDTALRDRIERFAHLIRTDPWGYPLVYPAGALIVTTGSDRRETGTHYTPKSLTETIVTETLTPLVYVGSAPGSPRERWELKPPAELLNLKVCDPAMGSGAFLVQACRWLADRLVESWARAEAQGHQIGIDGHVATAGAHPEPLPREAEARTIAARRLVAERCLYGVDLNPLAVELAKLSIWLVTLAKDRPFGFLDHNLRCGDSLLGIHRLDQLTQLSMQPTGKGQLRLFGQNIEQAVREAIELRQRLREMPVRDISDVEAMAHLDADARRGLEVPGCVADAFIGEVFSSGGDGAESTMTALAIQAERAIGGEQESQSMLRRRAISTLSIDLSENKPSRRPFHWPLEFPEVFSMERRGFDAMAGNPPFMGGSKISTTLGNSFREYLIARVANGRRGQRGQADLCSYFVCRVMALVRPSGTFGMISTNTISQGDTRIVGLDQVIENNSNIYWAISSQQWPGKASVMVALFCVKNGAWPSKAMLNGKSAKSITAYLTVEEEVTGNPHRLAFNKNKSFEGSRIEGQGFVLTPEKAAELIERFCKNSDVIRPYLRGDDFLSRPDQSPAYFVIDFKNWPLSRSAAPSGYRGAVAEDYPDCLDIIEREVKPQRLALPRTIKINMSAATNWWRYRDTSPALQAALKKSKFRRVLFHAFTSKHVAFGFVDSKYVFAAPHNLFIFDDWGTFSLLQSTLHINWAYKYCSTLGATLRYTRSSIFETFPFPKNVSTLADIGKRYYTARAEVMRVRGYGLRNFYNDIHDRTKFDPDIEHLRQLHIEMDRKVVESYGWHDLQLNHGHFKTRQGTRFTLEESISRELLVRLLRLNRKQYEEEDARMPHAAAPRTSSRATRARRASNTRTLQTSLDFTSNLADKERYSEAVGSRYEYRASSAQAIAEYLKAHAGWHAKADVLAATSITDGQWNAAIAELVLTGRVDRRGEKRGTRYRLAGEAD